MSLKKLIIMGAGGHSKSSIDVIESCGKYEIVGVIDSNIEKGDSFLGYPIIGNDKDLPGFINNCDDEVQGVVCVGQIKYSQTRSDLHKILKKLNILSSPIISNFAYVSSKSKIGDGSIIFHGSIINSSSEIGENCIINSQALIEHDVSISAHCHISTGAKLNGSVEIGEACFIGSGAVIKQGVKIGAGSVIGMGEKVFQDVEAGKIISSEKKL